MRAFWRLWSKAAFVPSFEAWKRTLVRICRAQQASGGDIRLFDFSGYNAITREIVPPPRDVTSDMHWYWKSGHFKKSLGDLIAARVVGEASNLGTELKSDNIDDTLLRIRDSRNQALPEDTTREVSSGIGRHEGE